VSSASLACLQGGARCAIASLVLGLAALGGQPASAAVRAPEPTVTLPAQHASRAATQTRWIVGARATRAADRVARRHGARAMRLPGAYVIDARRARALAAALRRRGLLRFAEPDVARHALSSFDGQSDGWARAAVVAPGLVAPSPTVAIGVVDDLVDPTHPDLAGHLSHANPSAGSTVGGPHGTMVASAAAGAANGFGVTGIFPGAPVVTYSVPEKFGCAESSDGILALANRRVPVINVSYGSPDACYAEYAAIAYAYAGGSLVVAAAGNEFQEGNPTSYPAAWPHVVSVAALDATRAPSYFSNENTAIDVAAPGEDIPLAIPVAFDTDGVADGITTDSGTSFSAPIVAGAAAWIRAARPGVRNGQTADLLRRTAVDIAPAGWDPATGYGQIDLAAALAAPLPRIDPLEPNDSIAEVDGTLFGEHDPSVWHGRGRYSLSATVDNVEDPIDVYRLRVPPRARFNVLVHPGFGDPDLAVYRRAARSLEESRHVVAHSERGAGRTDAVRLVNGSRATITVYVVVYVPDEASYLDARYRLEFQRKRRR
jgi:hypothetical protein